MTQRKGTPRPTIKPCGCPEGPCACVPLFWIEADVEAPIVPERCGVAELDVDEDGYQATCTDCGQQSERTTRLRPVRLWADWHAKTGRVQHQP